jgi:CHAD domain-containing protein
MGETPAIEALRELLQRQLHTIEQVEDGVRDGRDIEDLHKFRVATRRSRALIRASRPLIRDQLAAVDRELRWLGGLSSPVRDLDVLIGHLHELLDELGPDRAGAESIIAALERERLAQHETLVRAMSGERYRELLVRFAAALPRVSAVDGSVSLRRIAEKEYLRLRGAYEDLGADPPDEDLHELRIKAKHARYAAELAARVEGRSLSTLAGAARDMQDLIGAHQDAVVAEQRVRSLASGESALAAGRIVERQQRIRAKARSQVSEHWKRIRRAADAAFSS